MSPVPSPAPPPSHTATRHKQKPATVGIAAGAEDAKYHAKYKELKRKVKEIENDNDKLHFKVLQAKLNIRRMKMERAILYERLSGTPTSPPPADRIPLPYTVQSQLPPPRSAPGRDIRDHQLDTDQLHAVPEHVHSQANTRGSAPEVRPPPMLDTALPPQPHLPLNSPRRSTDAARHSYVPPMPPVHTYENSRSQTSPSMHHPHPPSTHSRNRSHSSSRSHPVPPQPYRTGSGHSQYPENLVRPLHSPPLSERERPRRSEYHEYPSSHGDPHPYDRHPAHVPLSPRTHPSEPRSSARVHNHQRVGPASYINRDDHYDRHREHRDLERESEREWERERSRDYSRPGRELISPNLHSPHPLPRSRALDRDYDHHSSSSRGREEAYYPDIHGPGPYPPPLSSRLVRPDTPGSGSVSGSGSGAGAADIPSRPDSREYYERDRQRPSGNYRLRGVHQDEVDYHPTPFEPSDRVGGYAQADHGRSAMESRKRTRNDMDVDSDTDLGVAESSGSHYPRLAQDDRGSKRYHRDASPEHR